MIRFRRRGDSILYNVVCLVHFCFLANKDAASIDRINNRLERDTAGLRRGIAPDTVLLLGGSGRWGSIVSEVVDQIEECNGLPDFLLRPFEVALRFFRGSHSFGKSGACLCEARSCLGLESEELTVFGVQFAGPAVEIVSVEIPLEISRDRAYICACVARLRSRGIGL